MKIGTVTGAAASIMTIPMTFLPSIISYKASTQLQALKINVLGDGTVLDLDTTGLDTIGKANRVASGDGTTILPLSNGLILKNVEIQVKTGGGTIPVFGFSTANGSVYVRNMQQKVFANSGVTIKDFTTLYLPSLTDSDQLTITYQNGVNQLMTPRDLITFNALTMNVEDSANYYYIQNQNQMIKSVQLTPAVDENIYISKLAAIGNLN